MTRVLCLLLAAAPGRAALTPTWIDGAGWLSMCAKTTSVFGVHICVTPNAWATSTVKCNHVVNVVAQARVYLPLLYLPDRYFSTEPVVRVAQLLDNDGDGLVDDTAVVERMVRDKYFLFVPSTEADSESFSPPDEGMGQMSGLWEAIPNSCDAPTNRGASATDRSTWAGAIAGASGCDPERDATTEEVLHLITEAAARVYPSIWGTSYSSASGAAIRAANGNCGNGYSGDYKDPSTAACTGQYAYNDETCNEACIVVEGIYWAICSYVGGLCAPPRG